MNTHLRGVMDGVKVYAALPFVFHVLAAGSVIYGLQFNTQTKDNVEWWMDSFIECFRLGPRTGDLHIPLAALQGAIAAVACVLHFISGGLHFRRYSYFLLLALYTCTQTRLLIAGTSPLVFGYLYSNIAMFTCLVLYHDSLQKRSHVT